MWIKVMLLGRYKEDGVVGVPKAEADDRSIRLYFSRNQKEYTVHGLIHS